MMNWTKFAGVCVVSGLLGCAAPASHVLKTDGPLMVDLYQQGADHSSTDAMKYSAQQSMAYQNTLYPQYEAYTREAANEIHQLFPQHENPTITIYVYPHMASKNTMPVPGYTTATQLYQSNQYALPSEQVAPVQDKPYVVDGSVGKSPYIRHGSVKGGN